MHIYIQRDLCYICIYKGIPSHICIYSEPMLIHGGSITHV